MLTEKNDKNIVWNAMIVLFLSLLIVYVIWYQTGKHDKQSVQANNKTIADTLVINPIENKPLESVMSDPTVENIEIINEIDTMENTDIDIVKEDVSKNTGTDIKTLSGTTLYFGPIEAIDKLGVNYAYALRDSKNIYFTRIEKEPDLSSIARSLGGTLYTMNTETEIVKNQLFGKRITFINLPEYKDRLVLMYAEVGQEKRLLQISFNIYHQSKRYLQDLFID